MHVANRTGWGMTLTLSLMLNSLAHAGNPLFFNESTGVPQTWPDNRAVYVVETGPIGTLSNDDAVKIVDQAFQRWASLPSVNLRADKLDTILPPEILAPFKRDLTVDDFVMEPCPGLPSNFSDRPRSRLNCAQVRACLNLGGVNCPSPIVFDNDGQIIASIFGPGVGVLGVSGPELFNARLNLILTGSSVINGTFFTAEAEKQRQAQSGDPDDTNALLLEGVLVHEIGHFLGLGHSVVNGDIALLNPSVQSLGSDRPRERGLEGISPLDPVSPLASDVETMYPTSLIGSTGSQNFPERDDESALAQLYPCTNATASSGGCSRPVSATGTIAGRVFIPDPLDQGQFKSAQGMLVVARRLDTDDPPPPSLKEAVSQLTGNTFAPRRCEGIVFLDNNQNGTPDDGIDGRPDGDESSFTGLFGACTRSDDPFIAGQAECQELLNDQFLGGGYRFVGGCGFFRLGFGQPRTIGQDPQENAFALTGLTPGKYLIQALPVFQGGFSSPVRSTVGLIDGLVGQLRPVIVTDDNIVPAFFPNPQNGEFYNGPATGCGTNLTSCGDEVSSFTDNPFVYTPIEVTAGGQVENVNIFMNTSERNFLGDPGFEFCRIGDVTNDNIVGPDDILEVLKQKERSDKGRNFNQRADINRDGQVSFFDVDLITDIATLPRPFEANAPPAELKRGLATFAAFCRAAALDGCALEVPVGELQPQPPSDPSSPLVPKLEFCTAAKEITVQVGNETRTCEIVGCPD